MRLTYQDKKYIITGHESVARDIASRAGFTKEGPDWVAYDVLAARKLAHYADPRTRSIIDQEYRDCARHMANSVAEDALIDIPRPRGLNFRAYQKAGVAYANEHRDCIIGDEMGLGKTMQAIGVINYSTNIKRVLIVTLNGLKLNWEEELRVWLSRPLTVGVASVKHWPVTDIVITHYECLNKYKKQITDIDWDLVVGDEIHKCKNPSAVRSKNFYSIKTKRKLGLSGTPLENRIDETFTIMSWVNPRMFFDRALFKQRFTRENEEELRMFLRIGGMVRRLKSEVEKELPPKTRQVIHIEHNDEELQLWIDQEFSKYRMHEMRIAKIREAMNLAKESGNKDLYDLKLEELKYQSFKGIAEMAKERKEVALRKLSYVAAHIRNLLEYTNKLIVFCHHQEVIERLNKEFSSISTAHYGKNKDFINHENVKIFNDNKDIKLLFASIKMATGYNAVVCNTVLFAELDWKPTDMSQAEDRTHRIGQARPVLVQHLILKNSLDSMMVEKVIEKQRLIEGVINVRN